MDLRANCRVIWVGRFVVKPPRNFHIMLERIAHGRAHIATRRARSSLSLEGVQLHRRGDAAFRFLGFLFMELLLSAQGVIVHYGSLQSKLGR